MHLDLAGNAFPYVAGQAVLVGLADRSERTPYSVACSPRQFRESATLELLVNVDHKGRAGRHLGDLVTGSAVAVAGPVGRFTLGPPRAGLRLLLVAGGTGIAPLRAMLWDAMDWPTPPEIGVLYSARTPDDFAYLRELRRLHDEGRLHLRLTVTRGASGDWKGCRRRIDGDLLASMVDRSSTLCMVCGPDSLVEDVPAMLAALGVPAARIRREEF